MVRRRLANYLTVLTIAILPPASLFAGFDITGTVVDCYTHRPIEGALITVANQTQRTDRKGQFLVSPDVRYLDVRAIGYSRLRTRFKDGDQIPLTPMRVRGLYLSFWGV